MKKYSVYSLFLVKVQNDGDAHYLICKHNELSDIYVGIFTNEKIKIINNSNVEPLSNYYSALYTTGKPLMLDKKELLRKYITINGEASLEESEVFYQNDNNTIETNRTLKRATLNFFPKQEVWYSHCFSQPEDLKMLSFKG